jgi:hypothetical protein
MNAKIFNAKSISYYQLQLFIYFASNNQCSYQTLALTHTLDECHRLRKCACSYYPEWMNPDFDCWQFQSHSSVSFTTPCSITSAHTQTDKNAARQCKCTCKRTQCTADRAHCWEPTSDVSSHSRDLCNTQGFNALTDYEFPTTLRDTLINLIKKLRQNLRLGLFDRSISSLKVMSLLYWWRVQPSLIAASRRLT